MALWGMFETANEKKKRINCEIRNRVAEELRHKSFEKVYDGEMRKLYAIVDDITTPPDYVLKKETYRDKKNQVLGMMIDEYKRCFSDKLDNKLQDAELFHQMLPKAEKVNDRRKFFNELRPYVESSRNAGKGESYIHQLNRDPLGSSDNPSLFKVSSDVSLQFQNREFEDEACNLDFIEKEVHKTIENAMVDFASTEVIKGGKLKVRKGIINLERAGEQRRYEQYESNFNHWNDILKVIIVKHRGKEHYDEEDIEKIRMLVKELELDGNNNPLMSVLKEKYGLDFMLKNHPNILVDALLNKVLTDLDKTAISLIRDGEDLSLLDPKGYIALKARRRALSQVMSNVSFSSGELMRQYKIFQKENPICKARTAYEDFLKVCNGKKEGEIFTKNEMAIFNAACKVHFELISQYLNKQIHLNDREHDLLDRQMKEIFEAMRYAQVDSNQSNTHTTKFFNAIGWSSNKPEICEDINKELKRNIKFPVKMFHTIASAKGIEMKEIVEQLIGTGEHAQQYYNYVNCNYGQGLYTAAIPAEKERKVGKRDDMFASIVSWEYGDPVGSVQFTLALNEHAKVIDNEKISEKMLNFRNEFPITSEFMKIDGMNRNEKNENKIQSVVLAFMGYNACRVKNPQGMGGIDYYCITDRKAITMDSSIHIRVNKDDINYDSFFEVVNPQKLEEYLAQK